MTSHRRLIATLLRPLRVGALLAIALVALALGAAAAGAATVQVRPGDTLSGLAARAGVSTQALAAANGIADPDRIVAGTVLRIPGGSAPSTGATPAASAGSVTVRPGESLSTIAARHGVSVPALASANGIADPDLVVAGTTLRIPGGGGAPSTGGSPAASAGSVTVRPGESLSGIAARHGVSVSALASANGIADPDRIVAGTVLRIPGGSAPSTGATPAASAGSVTVRPGESLSAIAARHGVSVGALASANGIADPDRVPAGAVLRLPSSSRGSGVPRGFTPDRGTVAQLLDSAAVRHGVDPALVRAVAWQESGWNQGVVSRTGAVGVMQLMPVTARWLGSDVLRRPFDPHSVGDNIDGGVAFLAWLQARTGDTRTTVAAYYQGLDSVRGRGLYGETRAYVASVLALRGRV